MFVASPDGLSEVANPAADTAEAILAAAAECPVGAISVEDAETGELLFPEAQPANGTAAGPVTPG